MFYLSRPYPLKIFKGCLPQTLLGPLSNTLSHLSLFLWSLSSVKPYLLRSFAPWSVSLLKKKLVPLRANAFVTAPPIVNNTDPICHFILLSLLTLLHMASHKTIGATKNDEKSIQIRNQEWNRWCSSLCCSASAFWLSASNIVSTSFINFSELFIEVFSGVAKDRVSVDFLWENSDWFIFLFKLIFMSMLPIKILMLYPAVLSILKCKLCNYLVAHTFWKIYFSESPPIE